MPSPKSGKKVSIVKPQEPEAPHEADVADPGQAAEVKASQQQQGTGKHGAVKAEPKSGAAQTEEELKKLETLEVSLVDPDGNAVPGEPYELLRNDAPVTSGTLNADGKVVIAGLEPGSYQWRFPKLHKDAWKKA